MTDGAVHPRRRDLGLLVVPVLGACTPSRGSTAAVQQQRTGLVPAAVRAVPLPCGGHPGDVTGLVLEGRGTPAGTVVVFGQAFRPGDVLRGARLAARLAEDGRPLPAQMDIQTRHPDGSARFAVVSFLAPALRLGGRAGVVLAARAAPSPAPAPSLDAEAALRGRRAAVEVAPAGGGEPWRADLAAALRAALAEGGGGANRPWQAGPLAVQARVSAEVPPGAAGGATSLRLVADVALRADGTLWADVWLRNDTAMRPGGGPASYGLRVLLDGREALRAEVLRQPQYTGWGRLLGAAADGQPAPAPALVRPDAPYLAEVGAVARYDLSTGVEEALLARLDQTMAAPAWAEPLSPRGIMQAMGAGGGRPDIGPATMWQAAWLITGDPRAAAYAIGQAEAAGAIPWHLWDPSGGAAGRGGWMDSRRWPRLWADARGGAPPRGLLQQIPTDTGWGLSASHQPDLSYVPFLLTGRRAFLDGLQAQAAWSVMWRAPTAPYRGEHGAAGPGEGVNVARNHQVRGSAWSIRQLDEAAWISPDDDSNRAFLRQASAGNWAWLRARIPEWTALQGEAHGWVVGVYGTPGALPPWQQDMMASTAAAAARRGDEDARAVLRWMGNFLVGRFLSENRGFGRNDGAAYNIAVERAGESSGDPPRHPLRTWAEIGEATRARGWSNGDGWSKSQGYYAQYALQSLAALCDLTGSEEGRRAYAFLAAAGAPATRPQDYMRQPTLNIVPRGAPRLPDREVRCAASAPPRE